MKHEADFDASADMRLLDLQRAALGVAAPARPAWQSGLDADGVGTANPEETPLAGALLVVDVRATPPSDVIPGAVVTLTLSVANEGVETAHDVRVNVPIPGSSEYRNGSFVRDGRPDSDAAAIEFLGEGAVVRTIAPGSRATFLWKLGVRQGTAPLIATPLVRAGDAAVIGAQSIAISRKLGAPTSFAHEVDRSERDLPFYELDEEERLIHEAVDSGLEAPAKAAPAGLAASPAANAAPATDPIAPSRDAVVLVGQLDRLSLQYFERLFGAAKPPTLLNHFMLAGALACTADFQGADAAGLKRHMEAQAQLLQRIVLHEKLGKKEPIAEYAGSIEIEIDSLCAVPAGQALPKSDGRALRFECEISEPALAVLRKMRAERGRWDFTKARQLALALQAQRVIPDDQKPLPESADAALRAYAQVSGVQMQRFFVRMRIDRTTVLLASHDEVLDKAARRLLSALATTFA
jgi:hypothetical protein